MSRYLLILFFIMLCPVAYAQTGDSLFVIHKSPSWAIRYTVKPGETPHMLATRFYLSDRQLENANDAATMRSFQAGTVITVPVSAENYYVTRQPFGETEALYYRVLPKDDIGLISTYSGVTKTQMRAWNNLHGNTIVPEQVLFVGWVKMIPYDTSNPVTTVAYPVIKKKQAADTTKQVVLGGLDTIYNRQTMNGANVLTEKGTAVFFEKTGNNSIYYAFHNATQRGSVIKVYNPSSGKTIYAKVLGPIPQTKLYANAIIGICNAAKEALGVTDAKAWCELSYSAN